MALTPVVPVRSLIEALLPWYHPSAERKRDAHSARVTLRSEVARARAERVIAEYRTAEERHHAAAAKLIKQARR